MDPRRSVDVKRATSPMIAHDVTEVVYDGPSRRALRGRSQLGALRERRGELHSVPRLGCSRDEIVLRVAA
jgi:hypothetical protein